MAAAWVGWGLDVYDGLLFNFVAPFCVPDLLNLHGDPIRAARATLIWTGAATSVLLLGSCVGGLLFGVVADKLGRSRTLLATLILYGAGTAACALAPSLPILLLFRFVAALGNGGEWAAGSSLVAEALPEKRRVEAGALLYSASPVGLSLAALVSRIVSDHYALTRPDLLWRWALATGLVAAVFGLIVRAFLKEPHRWTTLDTRAGAGRASDLFITENRRATFSGAIACTVSLVTLWTVNSLLPVTAANHAGEWSRAHHLGPRAALLLSNNWTQAASNAFTTGGLIGILATIPIAKRLGRRPMYGAYFLLSSASIFCAFGLRSKPYDQLLLYFPIGLSSLGIMASYSFYLSELFPTRLRATGAGFCFNVGRAITSVGPLAMAALAAGPSPVAAAQHAQFAMGFLPLLAVAMVPWMTETKGRALLE